MSAVLDKYNIRTVGMAWYTSEAWQELRAMPAAEIDMTYPEFVRKCECHIDVVKEFADLAKSYRINSVHGDDFARGFHDALWKDNGINFTDKKFTTSDNYLHLLPKLLAKQVRFIDSATLRSQFASLERHVPASGFEIIRKPQVGSARDDCAAAVAGAMVIAGDTLAYLRDYSLWI